MPRLFVFAGLPATGKTTLARRLAEDLGAAYLRIDTIEQALREARSLTGPMDDAGYRVAYALAEDNLRLGRSVVADSVNPLKLTRDAWLGVARAAGSGMVEIEVVCSDAVEHRRRAESRTSPTWEEIVARRYEAWDREHIVIDTSGSTPEECFGRLRRMLAG